MKTANSMTSRPWFICPTWAAVVPLLLHPLTTAPDSDEAAAAAAELQRLAEAIDQWNTKGPELAALLARIRDALEDDEPRAADNLAARALALLEGTA
jgi:hypothetical protein